MLFAVQPAAMNGEERVLDALDAILVRVEDDVHEAELIGADELEASAWYRSSRPDRQKLLEKIAEASLHRSPRTRGPHLRRVEVSDKATAVRAQKFACVPLLVLLENDVSDAALVTAALHNFASSATIELCFGPPSRLAPPAFEMESRGGHGELSGRIKRLCAEAAARDLPPRLVVVTDSDGEWNGDVKDYAQKIRDECNSNGIPCPPLNKRTAENYIPDAVWLAWVADPDLTAARPAVEALLRLSPEQRDHVHIGTTNTSPWNQDNAQAEALFRDVSSADFALLRSANLKGKKDKRMILALTDDRYKDMYDRSDLEARDHQGDLVTLVRTIEDEL